MAAIFTKQSGIRAVSVGADAHIGPLGSYEFAEEYRKTGISCGRTESSAPTGESEGRCRGRRLCRPEKCCEFIGDFRRNDEFAWADVGIGPYNEM